VTHIKHAVICAAGLGSRLGLGTTKCLIDINHKKIIDYQLELLRGIPDVRIVVGFQSEKVIAYVRKNGGYLRKNITFIYNYHYKTTSSSYSAYLGTRDFESPFLLLAGDLVIYQESFFSFLEQCKPGQSLAGITKAKSQNPIYVDLDKDRRIIGFQEFKNTGFEWPCVLFSSGIKIDKYKEYILENLFTKLPIKSHVINCYEIDTKVDLELAIKNYDYRVPIMPSWNRSI
jgi:NDP-sugar pyrophosphorylase family protein